MTQLRQMRACRIGEPDPDATLTAIDLADRRTDRQPDPEPRKIERQLDQTAFAFDLGIQQTRGVSLNQ